ncbi:hypothetical protein P5V15_004392 [Pogonomyrmex californicus]
MKRAEIPCSEKTIRRWIRRFAEGGDHALHDHRQHNRGPCRTGPNEVQAIVAAVADQPSFKESSTQRTCKYPKEPSGDVSSETPRS